MANVVKNLNTLADMPRDGILSIPVEDNEFFKVVLFKMPEGQYLSPHTSTMAATVQVLGGEAIFMLNGEDNEISEGDHFFMPPNCNHSVKATTDFTFLLHLRK